MLLSESGKSLSARTTGGLAQAPTLPLARPAPVSDQIRIRQRVTQAVEPDRATRTQLLGPGRRAPTIGDEEVDRFIPAGGVDLPVWSPRQLLDQNEVVSNSRRFGGGQDAHT
jgi:hypothetical protein